MSGRVVLLGHRIGYSASPAMHAAAFAELGLPLRYELRDVPGAELRVAVGELREPGAIGANVTQPHKVAVLAYLDEERPEVRRLGAANTIVRDGDRLVAHNTDLPAIAAELAELVGAERLRAVQRAVVLGRGGASRAAQAALADAGVGDVVVVSRDRWPQRCDLLADAELLVNATPIGTGSPESPVPASCLRLDLAVLDLVYRPSPTALVRDAVAAGAPARGGAGMLLRQAAASFALWTDRQPPLEAMRAALAVELGTGVNV